MDGNTITSQQQPPRRLYKSRRIRMIDGVCGGLAEYFAIDPTLIRIVWVLLTLLGGSGLLLYLAAMIVMPVNPADTGAFSSSAASPAPQGQGSDRRRFWGIFLVLAGAFVLMMNLGWIADINWWSFSHKIVFPVLLILLGGVLVLSYARRGEPPALPGAVPGTVPPPAGADIGPPPGAEPLPPAPSKELRRSSKDRKLFGVCGGLAEYFGVDSTIVRIVFICLVLASLGWALLIYIILGIVVPEDKPLTTRV